MKIVKPILATFFFLGLLSSCNNDNLDLLVPLPDDINFTELQLDRFSHVVPDGGFVSGGISFNTTKNADGTLKGGFVYSNRSNRSFTWTGTEAALDSNRYSVYTLKPNYTGVYGVCKVNDGDAFFTLSKPKVVEHILVGNTTYNFFAMRDGDQFGTAEKPEINPNITSKPKGVWYTYVPGGVKKFANADKDFFKLIVTGYRNGNEVGKIDYFLATMQADSSHPTWSYIRDDWYKVELSALGEVDKISFNIDSSDKTESGVIRTPSYFCIDGIRLK